MKNPPHPGRSIKIACLEPLGLSTAEGAKVLGVTRQTLNNVISGKSAITPEMAIRLTKAFGSSAETWLQMQMAYDLAQARKGESEIRVARVTERQRAKAPPAEMQVVNATGKTAMAKDLAAGLLLRK